MELFYTLTSFIFTIFLLFIFYLDYKKIFNFVPKFGFFITYLFNFVLVAAYFLWYLKQEAPGELSDSLLDQLTAKKTDIILVIVIAACNVFTKIFFKLFDVDKKFYISNTIHSSIMHGIFITIGILGLICRNFDLVFTVGLYFIGNHIGFSIHRIKVPEKKHTENTFKSQKFLIHFLTVLIAFILIFISNKFSESFQKYENYLLIAPSILLIVTIITIIILSLKNRSRVKEEFKNMFVNSKKILSKRFKEEKQKIKLKLYK